MREFVLPKPKKADADTRERAAHKEIVIGCGHPVYTIGDPGNDVSKRVVRGLAEGNGDMICSTLRKGSSQ